MASRVRRGRRGADAILHPVNAVGSVRWNAAFAYLDPARDRPNLTILADTLVDRVLLDGDRAIGSVATSAGELRAQTVVLAAGAYGSPGDPAAQRHRLGRAAGRRRPGRPRRRRFGFDGTDGRAEAAEFEDPMRCSWREVTVAIASSACADGLWDLFFFPGIDPPGERGYEASVAVFAMKPHSRGSVRLLSDDRARRSPSTTASCPTPATPRSWSKASRRSRARRGAARRARRGRDPSGRQGGRARARPRERPRLLPPVATCAIGRVVDERALVFGFDGLYVADASIMPTIPRVNTNLLDGQPGRGGVSSCSASGLARDQPPGRATAPPRRPLRPPTRSARHQERPRGRRLVAAAGGLLRTSRSTGLGHEACVPVSLRRSRTACTSRETTRRIG